MHRWVCNQNAGSPARLNLGILRVATLTILTLAFMSANAFGETSKELLAKGIAYYNNDDITDKAAVQFRQVLKKYRDSSEAEEAQYYLASYYQRKFYILKRNQGREDRGALLTAKTEYAKYTSTYFNNGSKKWLSDAFFNLALVYLQLKDSKRASWELNKMCDHAWKDRSVYIYEVVWSPDAGDVVDAYHDAYALGDFTRKQLKEYAGISVPDMVNIIKRWLRAEKFKK